MQITRLAVYDQVSRYLAASQTNRSSSNAGMEKALGAAQDAIQARQTDVAKGYTQTARERDTTKDSASALGLAKEAVQKLQSDTLSVKERDHYQTQFSEAMAGAGKAGGDQAAIRKDAKLANTVYDPHRVGSVAVDRLGKHASQQFASVADVGKLDVAKADRTQLAEAEKVLSAAQTQVGKESAAADRQVNRISGRAERLESARSQIVGDSSTEEKQTRDQAAIQALIQSQGQQQASGGMINLWG